MDIYHVIRRPLVTEKGTHQSKQAFPPTLTRAGRGGAYSFEVHPQANKIEIKEAVQKLFSVTVVDVNTMQSRGKDRRMGRGYAKLQNWKKAVVTLKAGDSIQLFDEG